MLTYHEFLADFLIQPKSALSWWANQSLLSMKTYMPAIYFHARKQIILRSALVVNRVLVRRAWSETTKTSSSVIVHWIQRIYRNWTSAYIWTCGVVQVRILHRSSVEGFQRFERNVFWCFSRGQGVFEVKNNADMYRLWRHIYQSGRITDHFWVHGFRTNAHPGARISLDHYDGKLCFFCLSVCLSICLPVCVL